MSNRPTDLPSAPATPLDVTATLAGKRLLFVGSTGFVGKVALSMLLRNYPNLGRVFVLVRPGAGSSAEDRFFRKVAGSPVFDPIREVWGDKFDQFLHDKCEPLAGDVARPMLNFTDGDFERIGKLDAIINCAGVVSFDPPLETALRINVYGVQNVIAVARRTGAAVVHVSTCFVAGERDGEIWEDEQVAGYFPRRNTVMSDHGDRGVLSNKGKRGPLRDEDFSVEAEVADCQRLIDQIRARADDRASVSHFRDKGAERLRDEGRDPDDERTLKIAVQRERKMWMAKQLTDLGMERARHWGWTNTYTYTKSLGDQLCATAEGLNVSIVRPAIVESSVRYPFPGWNEGFTTTAPLALLALMGHRNYPSGEKCVLDLIPVDHVAAGLIAATAATIADGGLKVYQLGSSDSNPLYMSRAVELLGLYKRRYFRERTEGTAWVNKLQARLEPIPVSRERFDRSSSPLWKGIADGVTKLIDDYTPRWGAPRLAGLAEHAKERLARVSSLTGQTIGLVDMFMPFIYERRYTFRSDNVRALFARLPPHDAQALRWDPEKIEWRTYWLDVHMRGLEKWVFPELEEEFKAKPKSVYTYRDLLEMFDATTKHHRQRTAMRMLPPVDKKDGEPHRYTYGDLQEMAMRCAAVLRERGVQPGDRVLLLSENRPEWGITYFGILKAGATAVPLDAISVAEEVINCINSARAKIAVISDKQLDRLKKESGADERSLGVTRLGFSDLFEREPTSAAGALVHHPRSDDLASLIFTSGTTGKPKGVMLSHKNFSSLIAKLSSVFDFDRHDGLLSVLPLHHTFEFTAGLLMPLMKGAQISYIDEINAESLEAAFDEGNVTGLIGVPALWQLLHRRIVKQLRERGPWVERAFDFLVEWNRKLREQSPPLLESFNLGKILFWPIHRRFGGRVRQMISGGSALPVDVMNAFRGMGFALYEGYGLTEAAPVLAVNRPGSKLIAGSVGEALPGIDLKINEPDSGGVGEVIASGPNVMAGYFEDPEATAQVLKDGWLYTGDLGKIDEEGRLTIVGRKKDVILGASGENVYPDELEERYRDSPYVKELSIVGLPDGEGSETVACLAVPDYEAHSDLSRDAVRERVRDHIKATSTKLPPAKRVKLLHTTDGELPKTATRKVKRKVVVAEIQRLERIKHKAQDVSQAAAAGGAPTGNWLYAVLAEVAGKTLDRVQADVRLTELGYDSLMFTELGVALETAGVNVPDAADLTGVSTVADLARIVESWGMSGKRKKIEAPKVVAKDDNEIEVPRAAVTIGNAVLDFGQRMTYERLFKSRVTGKAYLPQTANFLVAANHASHLDMGLVKHALGEWGPYLRALAAKDYFFEDPVRRAYFENFTNLVPMDRHGSLRESLRLASDVLAEGNVLLIFPEGTRSETGIMADFKPSIGYLALANQVDVLPMYLEGTHGALPKGSVLPKNRDIAAHIGPLITYESLRAATEKLPRGEQNRAAAEIVERAVRKLAPKGSVDRAPIEKVVQP
jgi:long-chain acyl-CoA synthetase